MTERFVTRTSDGETIDLKEEEAEHADLTANAKRVILTDSSGDAITSLNPLPVDTELTLDGNVIIDNVSVFATDISDSSTTTFAKVDSDGNQYTILTDGTNEIASSLQANGNYHLGVDITQSVYADPNNSSTTNLTSGNSYTFTGTATSTLGVVGLQVSLKTDQNCTVYIEQSPDETNWDVSDQFNYYSSINNFGTTVQAVNSYWRVRVILTGTTDTTHFRLQGVLCPIVEALPRSLDEHGHLKTAIEHIKDEYGFVAENTPSGELRAIEPISITGSNFSGTTIDPNFWTSTVANSATNTQANSQIILASGTNAAGSAKLNSVKRARFIGGRANEFKAGIKISSGVADNIRKWGVAYGATMPTITDGAYFQLSGTTFSIVTLKGGSATTVSSGSFNGVLGSSYTPNSNFNGYEIYYTNGKVHFVIGGKLIHTVTSSTTTWSDQLAFYIYMENVNSGSTTNSTITCRDATIRALGPRLTQPISKYQSGTTAGVICKYGVGNLHKIIISGVANNSAITLYDNTSGSGTIIWSSGAMGAQTQPFSIDFGGLSFYVGLTLVIATATASALVVYE